MLIDEALLEKIAFIKEGEFNEISGKPTLRLVGELRPTRSLTWPTSEKVVKVAISPEDILLDFLAQAPVPNPLEYIKQICTGSISFLPMHYYRCLAEESVAQLIKDIEKIVTRSRVKTKILRRLYDNESLRGAEPSAFVEHPSTKRRREFFRALMDGRIQDCQIDDEDSAKHFLVAVRALSSKTIHDIHTPLLEVLKNLYCKYYGVSITSADALRRTCCWIDEALYGE